MPPEPDKVGRSCAAPSVAADFAAERTLDAVATAALGAAAVMAGAGPIGTGLAAPLMAAPLFETIAAAASCAGVDCRRSLASTAPCCTGCAAAWYGSTSACCMRRSTDTSRSSMGVCAL